MFGSLVLKNKLIQFGAAILSLADYLACAPQAVLFIRNRLVFQKVSALR